MDYNTPIDWHPKFQQYTIPNQGLLLMSEREHLFLDTHQYQELIDSIDGNTSLNQVLTSTPDMLRGIQLSQHIETLLDKNILAGSNEQNQFRYSTNHLATPSQEVAPQVYLHLLTTHLTAASFPAGYFDQFLWQRPTHIVITDDFLSPSLLDFNQEYLTDGQAVLLLKLSGESFFVGPYFSGQSGEPCLKCMHTQMLQNQPVKKWLLERQQLEYIPIPTQTQAIDLKLLTPFIEQALMQPHSLLEINPVSHEATQHAIIHRPQCPHCGTTGLFSQQICQEVQLNDSFKKSHEGGSRAIDPKDTVKALTPFISPLTGVITDLAMLTIDQHHPVKTYRTAFFKTLPASKQTLDPNAFVQVSLGKGVSNMQSRASALCETIERKAAQYQGDEFWLKACPDVLEKRYYVPQQLANFSDEQYEVFSNPNHPDNQLGYVVKKYNSTQALHWIPAWSLTAHEQVYVPFTTCFANTPFNDEAYIRWASNGCAAGNTLEEAVLQGFYELTERDATAMWWYNKIKRQAVDINGLDAMHLENIDKTLSKNWHYWVLDISHDMGIPVMVGIAQHRQSGKFSLGLGCHLNPKTACQRALTELCQVISIRDQHSAPFDFDAIQEEEYLMPQGKPKVLSSFATLENNNIKSDVLFCVAQAKKIGLESLVVNYSRAHLPVKTAKVLVPGLSHKWPQLGGTRLYEVPVKMGWLEQPKTERELNSLALYI